MLNRDVLHGGKETNYVPIWVGTILIVGLLSLAGGLWLGSTVLDNSENKITALQADIQSLQTELEGRDSASGVLTEQLAEAARVEQDLQVQLSETEERVSSALESLAEKESQLELLASDLEQIDDLKEQIQTAQSQVALEQGKLEALSEMSSAIERHRLLLVELRKNLPETREESVAYWNSLKALAARADPALASSADKVILRIDNYFDWNDRTPDSTASTNEYLIWLDDYLTSGAVAYDEATANFSEDSLLAVITQMDAIVSRLN